MSSKHAFRERQQLEQTDAQARRRYQARQWRRETDSAERSVALSRIVVR